MHLFKRKGGFGFMKPVFLYGTCGQYVNYLSAIRRAGGRVLLSRDLYRSFDCGALLLPGGGDIDDRLDGTEHFLIQSFVHSGRPILGICRGMQALNVFFGGTLHRYITGHQSPSGDIVHPTQAAGLMRQLLGSTPAVNSCHHQSVSQLGHDLTVLQRAEDGTVEALAHETLPILGVQWHPERQSFAMRREDAVDAAPVFDYFLSQVR